MIKPNTDCMAIPPTTLATDAVPAAITEDAMTSGAGIGISPKNGRLNVAIASSLDKVSLGTSWFCGIVSGFNCNYSSFTDVVSSSAEDP